MIIKKWAKRHGINDASQGTLSSYSIVMMVLHYLQGTMHIDDASTSEVIVTALQNIYSMINNYLKDKCNLYVGYVVSLYLCRALSTSSRSQPSSGISGTYSIWSMYRMLSISSQFANAL